LVAESGWAELCSGHDRARVEAAATAELSEMGLDSESLSGDQLRLDVGVDASGQDFYRVSVRSDLVVHFSEPRVNVIESDTGFSVEVLGRTGMRYAEHGKSAFVDSEVLAKPGAIAVYPKSIRHWDPPHDAEPLDDEDRNRIVTNIHRAFAARGYEAQVMANHWP
jgi:hypothetical protein